MVRRAPTPRPTCSTASRSASPSCTATTIAPHAHVASPGCYPTAASLALAPLVADGLVEPTGIVVDAMSGVSGAGRALKLTSHFSEVDESVSAYGVLTHRHTAEIELALDATSGGARSQVLFTPHLVPMVRGHPRHVPRPPGASPGLTHRVAAGDATATSTRASRS